MSDDRSAMLSPLGDEQWPVWLSRKGARMCGAALVAAVRSAPRNGGGGPTDDFRWLSEVLRLATAEHKDDDGSDVGTDSETIRITVPSSAPAVRHLSVRSVAELAGVTDRAVRKAIETRRLPAQRPGGRQWLIDERDAQAYAQRRKRRDGSGTEPAG